MAKHSDLRIAIIGAGPAGIGAGHDLLEQGFDNFTIYEAAPEAGGTWHLHTYPGLACDVWAHSYTFSYRPNPDWSASFVHQPEIEQYLQTCAEEFGLTPHMRFNTRIASATYQEDGSWVLTSENGESFKADVIINAMGNQHTALYPDVPGMDTFTGPSWHSTRWNHDAQIEGKRVAIVGSAAAAVQIVPELARTCSQLTVLQRSPNWIMPRGRKPYTESRKRWFRRLPLFMRATQKIQAFMMSFVDQAASVGHKRKTQFENVAKKYINEIIPEGPLRDAVTPEDPYGCKRGLVSDDFYQALVKDNVELIAEGLAEVKPNSVVTSGGKEIEVDAIVYCTGYRNLDYDRIDVRGLNGKSLAETMASSPEAFKGIAAPDFPNYFFAMGPNGLVLNVSFFRTAERNIKTIVNLLKEKQQQGLTAIAPKQTEHDNYNKWLRDNFSHYSWAEPSCHSYYTTESGHIPFLFAGNFKRYCEFHDQCSLAEFEAIAPQA